MPNSRSHILECVAAFLAGLAWLGAATTALADPFHVYLPTYIDWVSDFPFVPSTVSGTSTVFTDARGDFPPTAFDNLDPVAEGRTWLPAPQSGAYMIFAGETILWSLGGSLSFGGVTFPMCAYKDFAIPTVPCDPNSPPIIPIATLLSANFGSFMVSGPVFAFDDSVPIGTWVIYSDDRLIPEPATLALLGLGFAGLGFARRKANMNKSKERSIGHVAMALMFAAMCLELPVSAHANLVLNPGFESNLSPPWFGDGVGVAGDGTGPPIAHAPHSGLWSAQFYNQGFISQEFPTTPGQPYEFSFWLSGDGSNWEGETFGALWEGTWVFERQLVLGSDWVFHSFIETATYTVSHILFLGESHVQLDDVSVTPISEPASLALLGLGLAGIGFARRKQ